MPEKVDQSDFDLLDELGVDSAPKQKVMRSPREQRILAGFEEIQLFVQGKGRLPGQAEDADIFEKMYAVRLEAIRGAAECREVLEGSDLMGLLSANHQGEGGVVREVPESDEALLEELGVGEEKR